MFHPQMHSLTEGFLPLRAPVWRSWPGLLADVWDVEGASGAHGEYVSRHARLFMVLDQNVDAPIHLSDRPGVNGAAIGGRLSYIPPDMPIWSHAPDAMRLRHLDLHVDLQILQERLGIALQDLPVHVPRLMFANERIEALAQIIAAECGEGGHHDLLGEGLATAVFVELFDVGRHRRGDVGQLSRRRLHLATSYLEENCLTPFRMADLAALIGLSPSYLSSAFKATTGYSPQQWQMRARIERVKHLLGTSSVGVSEVASLTGFADQAHMTRVFKQYVGLTPAAWRRQQD